MDTRLWVDMKSCQVAQYLDAFLPGWNSLDRPATEAFTFIAIRVPCIGPRYGDMELAIGNMDSSDYPLRTLLDVQVKLVPTFPPYRGDKLCTLAHQWGPTASILFDKRFVLARDRCGSWLRSGPESFAQYFRVVLDCAAIVTSSQYAQREEHQCTADFVESLGIGEWDRGKCSVWLGLQSTFAVYEGDSGDDDYCSCCLP